MTHPGVAESVDKDFPPLLSGIVRWVLVVLTLFVAFHLCIVFFLATVVGFVGGRMSEQSGAFRILLDPQYRVDQRIILIVLGITLTLVPVIYLLRFYREAARRKISLGVSLAGWSGSTAYHGFLVWAYYPSHGGFSIRTPWGRLPEIPFWCLSAAAAFISLSLLLSAVFRFRSRTIV